MSNTNQPISNDQLISNLNWRYATKKFDTSRKISAEDWAALEEAIHLSASSYGLQPWKFVVVTDPEVLAKLVPAAYGQPQVGQASHLVVFTIKKDFSVADVDALISRTAEVRGIPADSLQAYRDMMAGTVSAKSEAELAAWNARQTYIALGTLLTSAAMLGIDACPMEGFLPGEFDAILGLEEKGLSSVVICPLGYRDATDPYADLAKVRMPKEEVFVRI